MKRRPRIVMVKVGDATFIERDQRILSEAYDLSVFRFGTKSWEFLWSAIRFLFWILRHGPQASLFFTRFAHYHAFLLVVAGAIMRRKTAIVLGGSDSIWLPQYHYGVYDHWLSKRTTRLALKWAALLLPVHRSLLRGMNTYSDEKPREEGILAYNTDISTPAIVVPNGFDPEFWTPDERITRDAAVLTVAVAHDRTVFATKGVNYFLDVAEKLPQFRFIIVGTQKATIEQWYDGVISKNVEFHPPISTRDLRELYRSVKVFAQFTLTEGMPNVLCEAMLCGCVPVGSNVNAIPDIIGDAGVIVHKRDVNEMVKAIEMAMISDNSERARARIAEHYPLSRRVLELSNALNSLLEK